MLAAARLVVELTETAPSGGRPTRMLGLNPRIGVVLSVDVGETHVRLAAADVLAQERLASRNVTASG